MLCWLQGEDKQGKDEMKKETSGNDKTPLNVDSTSAN